MGISKGNATALRYLVLHAIGGNDVNWSRQNSGVEDESASADVYIGVVL